jgi:adenylate cyclase
VVRPQDGGKKAASAAVAAAIDLAERAAQVSTALAGAIPAGTAVHTGEAFVGATGLVQPPRTSLLGDAVNVTARLASAAGAGEVIVSVAAAEAAEAAGMPADHLERRTVGIRGRTEPIEVIVLPAAKKDAATT